MAQRNALGRGLDALIPGAPAGAEPEPARPREIESPSYEIRIDEIDPNPDQPRRRFEPDELERLAGSIRAHGVLQPVVVRRAGDRFQLIVGERRWRAARAAGLARIPVVVADVDPRDRLELALVENVQRRDLNPIELALAFQTLADGGATQDQIGERMGLDRSTVANHLRLLELPAELRQDLEDGLVSVGHAKALLQLGNPEHRRHLRDGIVDQGLSVRAAEERARALSGEGRAARARKQSAAPPADPDLEHLLDEIRQQLQTRVRLVGSAARGRLEIEFYGREDLDRIAALLLDVG